jgi:hypothetical protein
MALDLRRKCEALYVELCWEVGNFMVRDFHEINFSL